MSLTESLKKGMVIRQDGRLYRLLDFYVAQSGQQKPRVHVKLRSLTGDQTTERLLDQMGKLEEVDAEIREMQYLFSTSSEYTFMDEETFEQYPLSAEMVAAARDFLVEGETYSMLTVEGQPLEIQLPAHLPLEVAETAAVEHGGGGSHVYKDARLSSGLHIQVPLFIKTGEKVRVNTATREYVSKEH